MEGKIWLERDLIIKYDKAFDFRCENLVAAMVTQIFSYDGLRATNRIHNY